MGLYCWVWGYIVGCGVILLRAAEIGCVFVQNEELDERMEVYSKTQIQILL